jgi:hypothetical protein
MSEYKQPLPDPSYISPLLAEQENAVLLRCRNGHLKHK